MSDLLALIYPLADLASIYLTRPKPVGHDYLFSMAVGTVGEWLKLAPFLLGDEPLILKGTGGGSFLK